MGLNKYSIKYSIYVTKHRILAACFYKCLFYDSAVFPQMKMKIQPSGTAVSEDVMQ